ncbi:MAG: hypothetical protein IPJ77_14010 [Planctomycetes bacterium]|nr:hypothetical protein [Planctomycetota bacterium]
MSRVARYAGESFVPEERFEPDMETQLLLHLDGAASLWTPDASENSRDAFVGADARWVRR